MNKLLDQNFYIIKNTEVRLSKNNHTYVIVTYENVQTKALFRVFYFEAPDRDKKEVK